MTEVIVSYKGSPVRLDSRSSRAFEGLEFISHAHRDHLSRATSRSRVLCTQETSIFAAMRGLNVESTDLPHDFHMVPTGHMLGSVGLQICDSFFYTGDIKLNSYSFEPPCLPKTRCVLMESTYGCSFYRFPKPKEVLSAALDDIKTHLAGGRPCIIMGYPLGKSQHLQMFFDGKTECKQYVTKEIDAYNDIYSLSGYPISKKRIITETEVKDLDKEPWVFYHPMKSGDDEFLKYLKQKHDAVLMSFSGWAMRSEFAASMGVDLAYPLSDHADFEELRMIARGTDAETVFILGDNSDDLLDELETEGFYAKRIFGAKKVIKI